MAGGAVASVSVVEGVFEGLFGEWCLFGRYFKKDLFEGGLFEKLFVRILGSFCVRGCVCVRLLCFILFSFCKCVCS